MKKFVSLFLLLSTLTGIINAQDFKLWASVKGSPDLTIYLLELKGDKSKVIDSTNLENAVFVFSFEQKDHSGLYRIMLESEKSSNFFDEDPKYFDFVFNRENIRLEMDFEDPLSTMNVIESTENQLYYEFLKNRDIFGQKYFTLLSLLDIFCKGRDFLF